MLLGTGGVSILALQLAKAAGARVIITSSSDEKLERARALGADSTINYTTDETWFKTVRKLTDGRGVDQVVEVGGAATLEQSVKATAVGGRIAVIGVLSGVKSSLLITPILMGYLRLQGVLVGHRTSFEAMNAFITEREIRPQISDVIPWKQARDGFDLMAQSRHFGKICLTRDSSATRRG